MTEAFLHPTTVVDADVEIGAGSKIWHFCHLLSRTHIGENCVLGQNVAVGPDVTIGDNCKIQNNVSIFKGVTLEGDVFCGPSMVFTNVMTPRAFVERKDEFRKTLVGKGASIGANATIICGTTIGRYSMIGAGAVVTKDVSDYSLVVGNPARHIGWVSKNGERLGDDLKCPATGVQYEIIKNRLTEVKMSDRSPIALVDLKAQYNSYKSEIDEAIQTVLEHAQFIMGPEVSSLETNLSEFTGAAHTVACSSGTDALAMMLMADNIGAGDAVFVPAFTFTATAEVPLLLGATPVFVDVDPNDFNISPEDLERCILETLKEGKLAPKGIIAADLFGMPANYVDLKKITDSHGMQIWADAAQSLGGSFDGQKVGNLARMSGTSFFPAKPLGCYGDGGAVFTDDEEIAYRLRSIRAHGKGAEKYDIERIGMNGRLDTIQAAILDAKLPHFQDEISKREEISNWYDSALPNGVTPPARRSGAKSAWAWYTIKFQETDRDAVAEHLKTAGIPSAVYYPRPMHLQTAYLPYGKGAGSLPVSEGLCDEVLSLPIHPFLSKEDVLFIAEEISECVAQQTKNAP